MIVPQRSPQRATGALTRRLAAGGPGRCHVCNGPPHPRFHLADPTSYGLTPRRRDDYGARPVAHQLPVWLRRRQGGL